MPAGCRGCVQQKGTAMGGVTEYRQYAADCVRQAQDETTSEDKAIMLNVALAWLRLAQQREANGDMPLEPEPFEEREFADHDSDI